MFKVGDRIRQKEHVRDSQSPYAIITRISGEKIYHIHDGQKSEKWCRAKDIELNNEPKSKTTCAESFNVVLKDVIRELKGE